MEEQLTLNQLVVGSSPTRGTSFSASVAELVDAADSKSASFTRVWVRVPPLVPL